MKHLAIIAALLASFGAQAQALNLVCGNTIATITANDNNEIQSVTVDNVMYNVNADVTRKVERGQMVTYFQATNANQSVYATVIMLENGDLGATLYTNKLIWKSKCRWAE